MSVVLFHLVHDLLGKKNVKTKS